MLLRVWHLDEFYMEALAEVRIQISFCMAEAGEKSLERSAVKSIYRDLQHASLKSPDHT